MAEDSVDENQDSKPDDASEQELEPESTPEAQAEEVDVEALKAENARLEKVAKDQKGRADKAEIQLKELKKKPQEQANETPSDDKFQRLELKTDGYSSEEADFILRNGGIEAANDPYVKEAIASMRKKAKSLEATPAGTAKSPVFKKFSERELKNMPLAELEKIVPQE